MTIDEFFECAKIIRASFPNQRFNDDSVDVYMRYVRRFDARLVLAATIAICAEPDRVFLPSPGQLLAKIVQFAGEAPPPFPCAWDEVNTQMKSIGYYGKPKWTHPAIEKAVRAVGWRELCHASLNDMGTLRAQFRDIYGNIEHRFTAELTLPADVRQLALDSKPPTKTIEQRDAPMLPLSHAFDKQHARLAEALPVPSKGKKWSKQPSEIRARHRQRRFAEEHNDDAG